MKDEIEFVKSAIKNTQGVIDYHKRRIKSLEKKIETLEGILNRLEKGLSFKEARGEKRG